MKGQSQERQLLSNYKQIIVFWFSLGHQLMGWGPLTLEMSICFTRSIDSNAHLTQKHSQRHTHNNVGYAHIQAPHGPCQVDTQYYTIRPLWQYSQDWTRRIIGYSYPRVYVWRGTHSVSSYKCPRYLSCPNLLQVLCLIQTSSFCPPSYIKG